jgi:hypothetical protein
MEREGSLQGSQAQTLDPIQSTSHPNPLRYSLILSYLLLGLSSGLFPLGFQMKILYAFLISPTCAAYPAHLIFLVFDYKFQQVFRTTLQLNSATASLCSFIKINSEVTALLCYLCQHIHNVKTKRGSRC